MTQTITPFLTVAYNRMEDFEHHIVSSLNLRQLIKDLEEERLSHPETKQKQIFSYISEYSHTKIKRSLYNFNGRRTSHVHENTLKDQDLNLQLKKGLRHEIVKTPSKYRTLIPDNLRSMQKMLGHTPDIRIAKKKVLNLPISKQNLSTGLVSGRAAAVG